MLIFFAPLLALAILWIGWLLDRIFGDPQGFPHLVVGFGHAISRADRWFNNGFNRKYKGALVALLLILLAFTLTWVIFAFAPNWIRIPLGIILVSTCLAGHTLIKEVREVFAQLAISLESGRNQLSRIVGRDTKELTEEEVKTAALETLSENLSDGVIAPLFWFAVLGMPGMVAYKMINTLDSMIGYKNEKYGDFGYLAAKIDDVANWIPARLTALLMLAVNGRLDLTKQVFREGKNHTSPNSGYPEAALALMLGCQFGGGHYYGGQYFEKPTIGKQQRTLIPKDLQRALRTNRSSEVLMLVLLSLIILLAYLL